MAPLLKFICYELGAINFYFEGWQLVLALFASKLSSGDKILSSLIKKAWYTCTFLNHFREANQQ